MGGVGGVGGRRAHITQQREVTTGQCGEAHIIMMWTSSLISSRNHPTTGAAAVHMRIYMHTEGAAACQSTYRRFRKNGKCTGATKVHADVWSHVWEDRGDGMKAPNQW